MTRLATFALLTGLFARVYGLGLKFVNPPPYDSNDGLEEDQALYKVGDTVDVKWTMEDDSKLVYLVLNQVKLWGLDTADSGEFVMRTKRIRSIATSATVNATSYSWVVKTNSSLTMSSLFFLNVFGSDGDSSTSQYFHIEANSVSEGATSSSLAVTSTSSSIGESTAASTLGSRDHSTSSVESGTSSASTPTSDTANAPTSSIGDVPGHPEQPAHQHIHNDFPLSLKIGLGIGLPATLTLGIIAGWLLFRRHQREKRRVSRELPHSETGNHADDPRTYGEVYEAPSDHILEVGKDHEQLGGKLEDKPAIKPEILPLRYEMEANTVHELQDQPVKPDEPVIKKET
ncbi:hypothetical protein J4E81_009527 [Alternaria sp. BMP 2799]|nr:hypothetical protein J4E81_009527 [Alternaria sp. BMP 2799]